jgi:hypothetical protein
VPRFHGLADSDSTTGAIQRALLHKWELQSAISARAGIHGNPKMVRQLLERLVREGRAESRTITDGRYMSGQITEYRRCPA